MEDSSIIKVETRLGEFWRGVQGVVPLLFGVFPFGMIFGALSMKAGLGSSAQPDDVEHRFCWLLPVYVYPNVQRCHSRIGDHPGGDSDQSEARPVQCIHRILCQGSLQRLESFTGISSD